MRRPFHIAAIAISSICLYGTAMADTFYVPPEHAVTPAHLQERQATQFSASTEWNIFTEFGFERLALSGQPSWRHTIVDDAGKDYKPVHYDHGNGVAAADVNSDGLPDLYFTNQLGSNALWLNQGDGKFADATEPANVAVADRISVAASFADIDNDGDADLYVTTVRGGNLLFENDGTGVFTDISARSGTDYQGHSSGAVFFDYDRDGLLDLFVSNVGVYTQQAQGRGAYFIGLPDAFSGHLYPDRTEISRLYRNLGENRFADVTEQNGLIDAGWTGDALPIDINGDRWTDLYTTNMQGLDRVWINERGTRFVDTTDSLLPRSPWGSMGIAAIDFENDGDFDIAVSDMHSDMSEVAAFDQAAEKQAVGNRAPEEFLADAGRSLSRNAFYTSDDGTFEETGIDVGIDTFWPWGISAGDLNADGYEDLLVTGSMNYPYRYGINSILLNENGKQFRDAEFVLGLEPRAETLYAPWFDLDCADSQSSHQACQVTGSNETLTIMASSGSRSSIILDFDNDGDLDIVTSEFNQPPILWQSDLSQNTTVNALVIELEGTADNRQGLGAHVTLYHDGGSASHLDTGKSGYLSQSALPIYIATGLSTSVDKIEVRWPNGTLQTVAGPIDSGIRVRIVQE